MANNENLLLITLQLFSTFFLPLRKYEKDIKYD
jgi:hypothetical protein